MGFRAICVATVLAGLSAAGCGTVANLANSHPETGGRTPFGGVRKDVVWMNEAGAREAKCRTDPALETEQLQHMGMKILYTLDVPFSFVGDVLSYPYTASFTCINQPTPVPPLPVGPPGPPQPGYVVPTDSRDNYPSTLPMSTPQPAPKPPAPQTPPTTQPPGQPLPAPMKLPG